MQLHKIIKKYDINLLLTFGSYNTDRYTENSDIDLAYASNRDLTEEEKDNILGEFVNYFCKDGIDLVDISKVEPLLGYEIACNSSILYEENASYIRFILKASSRYADTKHLRDLRKKYLFEYVGII